MNGFDSVTRLSRKKRPVVPLILIATAITVLLLVGLTGWFIHILRAEQLERAESATSNVARLVGAQVESAMKTAQVILVDVKERVEQGEAGSGSSQRLRNHLVEVAQSMPELHGVFVYAADGTWLATSSSLTVTGNNSDRAYFKHHRSNASSGIYIGGPVKSRSTGAWIIPVSMRLNRPDGGFAGVALVTFRVNFFEALYDRLDIGKSGTVLLALADGTVVYRKPFREDVIGSNLSDGSIWAELRTKPVGSAMLVAKVDGIERLYAFRKLQTFPFVVAVGMGKDELLQSWRAASVGAGMATSVACIILIIFVRKLVTQIFIREKLDAKLRAVSVELQQHNAGLEVLAATDRLTGIANRRRFDEVLLMESQRARRTLQPLSLILLDVDQFKKFNDEYGHVAGDDCLRRVAQALSASLVRPGDVSARYGGEEFAAILPGTDILGAVDVAERIRGSIQALSIPHTFSSIGVVTVSLGVASWHPNAGELVSVEDLIECADKGLYRAKKAGRNKIFANNPAAEFQSNSSAQ